MDLLLGIFPWLSHTLQRRTNNFLTSKEMSVLGYRKIDVLCERRQEHKPLSISHTHSPSVSLCHTVIYLTHFHSLFPLTSRISHSLCLPLPPPTHACSSSLSLLSFCLNAHHVQHPIIHNSHAIPLLTSAFALYLSDRIAMSACFSACW